MYYGVWYMPFNGGGGGEDIIQTVPWFAVLRYRRGNTKTLPYLVLHYSDIISISIILHSSHSTGTSGYPQHPLYFYMFRRTVTADGT